MAGDPDDSSMWVLLIASTGSRDRRRRDEKLRLLLSSLSACSTAAFFSSPHPHHQPHPRAAVIHGEQEENSLGQRSDFSSFAKLCNKISARPPFQAHRRPWSVHFSSGRLVPRNGLRNKRPMPITRHRTVITCLALPLIISQLNISQSSPGRRRRAISLARSLTRDQSRRLIRERITRLLGGDRTCPAHGRENQEVFA